jgi:hypothetical protein
MAVNRRALLAVIAVLVLQAVFVFSFVYAQADPEPHDLPVGIAAPARAATGVERAVERRRPGAFEFTRSRNAQAARAAVRDREVYGALVLSRRQARLYVASAASPVVAAVQTAAFSGAAPRGTRLVVTDLVPLDRDDPRGLSFQFLLLPLVITGILAPMFLLMLAPALSPGGRFAALALFSSLGGVASIALVNAGLGVLPGPFGAEAGVVILLLLAVSLATAAFMALRGPPGVGLGFLVFLIIGNVASGAGSAPEMLPGFWRAVSPYLPPGAGVTALRNTAYFDGAALQRPLIVLGAFALVGAAITLLRRGGPLAAMRPRPMTDEDRQAARRERAQPIAAEAPTTVQATEPRAQPTEPRAQPTDQPTQPRERPSG